MKKEKMIADELQFMFLEGKLGGLKEEYINHVTRKLRTGEMTLLELMREHPKLKRKLFEAIYRLQKSFSFLS